MSFANGNCVETARDGGNYYILDAKDKSQGPVDVITADDYEVRHALALETGDVTAMFSGPDVTERFSQGELHAYGLYLQAGALAVLNEGDIVTAYENPAQYIPDLAARALAGSDVLVLSGTPA